MHEGNAFPLFRCPPLTRLCLLALVAGLACPVASFGANAASAGLDVTLATTFRITAPRGFSLVGPGEPGFARFDREADSSSHRLLAVLVPNEEMSNVLSDQPCFHWFRVQVLESLAEHRVSDATFQSAKKGMHERFGEMLSTTLHDGFVEAAEGEPDVKVGRAENLGVFSEGTHHLSHLTLVQAKASRTRAYTAHSSSMLLLDGQLLYLYGNAITTDRRRSASWVKQHSDIIIEQLVADNAR